MKTVCKKLFSLMLVAILLVSAIPFQAFADGESATVTEHSVQIMDATGKAVWSLAVPEGSTIAATLQPSQTQPAAMYSAVNNKTGYDLDQAAFEAWAADLMNQVITGPVSASVPASAYEAKTYTLVLDAGDGKIGEDDSRNRTVTYDAAVGDLPDATLANHTFLGWYNGDTKLTSNTIWKTDGGATYTARFEPNLNSLTISKVKTSNGKQISSETIATLQLMENVKLLNHLENVWQGLTVDPGYEWDEMWYNNAAGTPLTSQSEFNNANRAVFVKFTAKAYTLTFNPGTGGKVSPTAKVVYYDSAVGELPTPTCDGKVFSHWEDDAGNKVTASTIYKTAGNSRLNAVYQGEIKVNLHMHTEKSKTGGLIAPLSGYVAGDEITQTIAMNVVKQYYSGNMTFVGLFNTSDWNQYVEGKNPTGKNFVEIPDDATGTYTIHVMINNGTLGTGGNTTDATTAPTTSGTTATNPTTKPADSTNPATGDTMLNAVLPVMMISAAALVVMMQLRKRKMI